MIVTTNGKIPGWKYYNHAAIPTCAPHETPDLTPIKDGSIWKMDGKPLLARYTTDWDCGYDTGWWYLIKEAPFDMATLSSNSRKHIKEAFRKTEVKKIDPVEYVDALYECSHQAFLKYKLASNEIPFESFKKECCDAQNENIEYWAGYEMSSKVLIGFLVVKRYEDWVSILTAKFDSRYLKLRVSDALYATVLDFYLNQNGKNYVSSGTRSISHESNTQEYKESHFGYRKAFCRLNIAYSGVIAIVVKLAYPFRGLIEIIGRKIKKVHLLSAVLKMEELRQLQGEKK